MIHTIFGGKSKILLKSVLLLYTYLGVQFHLVYGFYTYVYIYICTVTIYNHHRSIIVFLIYNIPITVVVGGCIMLYPNISQLMELEMCHASPEKSRQVTLHVVAGILKISRFGVLTVNSSTRRGKGRDVVQNHWGILRERLRKTCYPLVI